MSGAAGAKLTRKERTWIAQDLFSRLQVLDPEADETDYCHDGTWDLEGINDDIRIIRQEEEYTPMTQTVGAPKQRTREKRAMPSSPSPARNPHPPGAAPTSGVHPLFYHINPTSSLAALVDENDGVLFPRASRVPAPVGNKKHSNMVFTAANLERHSPPEAKEPDKEDSPPQNPDAQSKLTSIVNKVEGSKREMENQINRMYVRVLSQERSRKNGERPCIYPVEGIIHASSVEKSASRAPGDIVTLANGWHCHQSSYGKKWRYAEHEEVHSTKFHIWEPPSKDITCAAILVHGAGQSEANGLYKYTPYHKMSGLIRVSEKGAGIDCVYKTQGWFIREVMQNSHPDEGYPRQPSLRRGDAIVSINGRTLKGIGDAQQVETMRANIGDGRHIVIHRPACWTHVSGNYRIRKGISDHNNQIRHPHEWHLEHLHIKKDGTCKVTPLYSAEWTQGYGRNSSGGKTNPPFRLWDIEKRRMLGEKHRPTLSDKGPKPAPVLVKYQQPRTVMEAISVLCSAFPNGIAEKELLQEWQAFYGRSIQEMYLPHVPEEKIHSWLETFIRQACKTKSAGLFKQCIRCTFNSNGELCPLSASLGKSSDGAQKEMQETSDDGEVRSFPDVRLCLKNQLIGTKLPDKEVLDRVTQSCDRYIESVQATAGVRMARIKIIKIIDNAVRNLFQDAYLELHGSVQMQIDVKTSDLDITIRFRKKPRLNGKRLSKECKRRGRTEPQLLLEQLARILKGQLANEYFQNGKLTEIFSTRIPIINVKTNPDTIGEKIELDIKVSHHGDADMLKTLLMCRYIDIGGDLANEPRVRKLIMIVKHWAKKRAIQDASRGYLNSFSYCLLVIQFLQLVQPPVLPTLKLPKGKEICLDPYVNDKTVWPDWFHNPKIHAGFSDDNKMSVGELWYRFIHYYAHVNFSFTCFSVRHGRPQFKPNCPLNARHLYLAIMDPVDERDSTSRNVCENITTLIRSEFSSALDTFQANGRSPRNDSGVVRLAKERRKVQYALFKKLCEPRLVHKAAIARAQNAKRGGKGRKKKRF